MIEKRQPKRQLSNGTKQANFLGEPVSRVIEPVLLPGFMVSNESFLKFCLKHSFTKLTVLEGFKPSISQSREVLYRKNHI